MQTPHWYSNGYICQSCIITHKDLQENVDIKAYRTEEMYNRIMQKFQDDDEMFEEEQINIDEQDEAIPEVPSVDDNDDDEEEYIVVDNSEETGNDDDINEDEIESQSHIGQGDERNFGWQKKCVYNKLQNFHILSSFPFDILHDVFEGLFSYDIPSILIYFIKYNNLTYKKLNKELTNFPYSTHEQKDKPALFIEKKTIKFTRLAGKGMASSLLVKILFTLP